MKSLIRFSRRRPIAVFMICALFCLLGLNAALRISLSLLPQIDYPGFTLQTDYAGIGPEKMEEIITRPLEESISTVGGIREIFSISEEGRSRINIEINRESDPAHRAADIRARADIVAALFPGEAQKPVLLKYDPEQKPVIIIALRAKDLSSADLREIAERDIKKSLESVDGVSEIFVIGGEIREIQIECDSWRLRQMGVSAGEILNALQGRNVNYSAGRLNGRGGVYHLYARGRFKKLREIGELAVKTGKEGRMVLLKDVALVKFGYQEKKSASRVNGKERVALYIHRTGAANVLKMSQQVKKILKRIKREDLKLEIVFDGSLAVRDLIFYVVLGLGVALLLSMGLLRLLWGDFRRALFTLSPLPVSFCVGSFFLYIVGSQYNAVTLSGLILSAGIILMLAYIMLRRMESEGLYRGLIKTLPPFGLGVSLLAAALFPLLFANPEARALYGGLAIAVLVSLVSALVYCSTVIPALLHVFGTVKTEEPLDGLRNFLEAVVAGVIFRITLLARRRRIATMLVCIGLCIPGYMAYKALPFKFFQSGEKDRLNASIEFPSGASFKMIDELSSKIENALADAPGVKEVNSRVESSSVQLILKLYKNVRADETYIKQLENISRDFPPAFLHFQVGGDTQAVQDVTVDVSGADLKKLDKYVRRLADAGRKMKGVEGIVFRYKSPRPEIQVVLDRELLDRAGLTTSHAAHALRYAYQGGVATKFIGPEREIDVKVLYDKRYRQGPESLGNVYIKNRGGRHVPLLEVATLRKSGLTPKIYRKNKKRTLSYTMRMKSPNPDVLGKELKALGLKMLEEGYRLDFGRELKDLLESGRRFTQTIAFALLLIYMVLAAYFESLRKPPILLLFLPLPVFFAIGTLWFLDFSLTAPALIGMLILAALVSMLSVLISDRRPARKMRGKSLQERFSEGFVEQLASYLILFIFFTPFFFLPGAAGNLLAGVTVTIASGVFFALLSLPVQMRGLAGLKAELIRRRWFRWELKSILPRKISLKIQGLLALLFISLIMAGPLRAKEKNRELALDLETAVRVGAANHFMLKSIHNRKAAIRALITERWRKYLPSLSLGYERRRNINAGERDVISHDIRLNAEQVLYDGGRRALNYDLAKMDAVLAANDFWITYNRLRLDIQKAYLTVLAARGKINLNRKSLQRGKIQLRQARHEEKLGFGTRLQVLTVAAKVREIELALRRAENEYIQSKHDLKLVLNLDFEIEIRVKGDLFQDFILKPPHVNRRLLVRRARTERVEVKRSQGNIHKLKKEHLIAKDSWIPRFSVSGFLGRSGETFPVRTKNWGVNFKLSFPIGSHKSESNAGTGYNKDKTQFSNNTSTSISFFDDLGYGRRVIESKNSLGEAVYQHRQLHNKLAIDVYKSCDKLLEAWETIRIGNGNVYFRHESLKLMNAKFSVGQTKRSEIVFAETELVKAQEDLTEAISTYILSAYELEWISGINTGSLKLFRYKRGEGNTLLKRMVDSPRTRDIIKKLPEDEPTKADKPLLLPKIPGDKKGKDQKTKKSEEKLLLDDLELDDDVRKGEKE